MPSTQPLSDLDRSAPDEQIAAWRAHLRSSRTLAPQEMEALEARLREQVASLQAAGLAGDEAFLVALKRIGASDRATREHAAGAWKEAVQRDELREGTGTALGSRTLRVALGLAVAAAIAIKLPALFGVQFDPDKSLFYPLNLAFFTLPFIAAYFAWARQLGSRGRIALAAAFAVAAAAVNAFPFPSGAGNTPAGDTHVLTILHLPIALWLLVGVAYVGGRWRGNERRMDFIRFTGELFIYYVLIALGGGVVIGMTVALFRAIGVNPEQLVVGWIVPCGIAGAAVVASWLAEARQGVMNLAPVLTHIFSPLFALLFLAFLVTMLATGQGIDPAREILIVFDLLLVVVFALLLYSFSARDALARPGLNDWILLTLLATALVVDLLALWAVGSRISSFGFTPNRVAALGENLVLLANLAGSAVLFTGFVRGRAPFERVLRWQMSYLYVLAGWAAMVAFLFPPLFGFR